MNMNLKDIKVMSHNSFCANDELISINEFKKAYLELVSQLERYAARLGIEIRYIERREVK